jgi:hypothetical protein
MDEPDSDFEPEVPMTRQEMFAQIIWPVGIIGGLWLGLKLVTALFPEANPYVVLVSVAGSEMAILYGITLWRRHNNA